VPSAVRALTNGTRRGERLPWLRRTP
jgi:hypothetical protein